MGDTASLTIPGEFHLRPDQLLAHEMFNVRRFFGDPEIEAQEVERLAATIERDGQMDTVIVTQLPGSDEYVIVGGHRRRRAISMLNERRVAGSQPMMLVRCRLDKEGDLKRKARIHNIQRKDPSPMDIALEVEAVMQENKWEGFKGAKKTAEYFGLNLATVTQLIKLLTASDEVKQKVNSKELSVQAAYDMLNVKPEAEATVLARAQENQRQSDQRLTPKARKARVAKGIEDGSRIERPAIVDAIRDTPGASTTPINRSKKDLLEAIELFDSPAYGHDDGAVRQWARHFVDKFATGEANSNAMRKRFDAMVAKAPKGTRSETPAEKAAKGKTGKGKKGEGKTGGGKAGAKKKSSPVIAAKKKAVAKKVATPAKKAVAKKVPAAKKKTTE